MDLGESIAGLGDEVRLRPTRERPPNGGDVPGLHSRMAGGAGRNGVVLVGVLAASLIASEALGRTLKETVGAAIRSHPSVAASIQRTESAKARIDVERGALFPWVNLRGDTGVEYTDSPSTRDRATRGPRDGHAVLYRNQGQIVVNQLLYDGGRTLNLLRAAKASRDKAAYTVGDTQLKVAIAAIAAHIDVVRQGRLTQIAGQNVAAHRTILGGLRRRVAAGLSTAADVSQARTRLARAVSTARVRAGALRQARIRYFSIVGSPPPADLEVPRIPGSRLLTLPVGAAVRTALARNPEIGIARAEVRSREYQFDATRGVFVPKVNFEFLAGVGNNIDGIAGRDSEVRGLVLLSWNLYRGGADIARRREALQDLFTARHEETDARRIVEERVRQSRAALRANRARASVLGQRAGEAARVVRAYQRQFEAGQRSLLDRLDAQDEMFLARAERADAHYTAVFEYYHQLAVTGRLRGWIPGAQRYMEPNTAIRPQDPEAAQATRAPDPDEYREAFEALQQEPDSIPLNLRYARLAEAAGEPRKALEAYRRVLAQQPAHPIARPAVERIEYALRPNLFQATALVGVEYESNPRRSPRSQGADSDFLFSARLLATDERRWGRYLWRTTADVYGNAHINEDELNFGVAQATVGPVIPTYRGYNIRPFIGGGYAWFDARTFFAETTAGIQVESATESIFRSVTLAVAYDFVGRQFSTRDAIRVEIKPSFVLTGEQIFPGFELGRTRLVLAPYYGYNTVTAGRTGVDPRGDPFPLRFHQVGGRMDYFVPLPWGLVANANLTVEYRHFLEQVVGESQRRRDLFLSPGAQLIVTGLFRGNADVILSYAFEQNNSTDSVQDYSNHVAALKVLWRIR